jgi:hypothetical protein
MVENKIMYQVRIAREKDEYISEVLLANNVDEIIEGLNEHEDNEEGVWMELDFGSYFIRIRPAKLKFTEYFSNFDLWEVLDLGDVLYEGTIKDWNGNLE